jgi:hypothetical protein
MKYINSSIQLLILLVLCVICWQQYEYRPVTNAEIKALIQNKERTKYVDRLAQRPLIIIEGDVDARITEPLDVNVVNDVNVNINRR